MDVIGVIAIAVIALAALFVFLKVIAGCLIKSVIVIVLIALAVAAYIFLVRGGQ